MKILRANHKNIGGFNKIVKRVKILECLYERSKWPFVQILKINDFHYVTVIGIDVSCASSNVEISNWNNQRSRLFLL